jgi:hypothetical protein
MASNDTAIRSVSDGEKMDCRLLDLVDCISG